MITNIAISKFKFPAGFRYSPVKAKKIGIMHKRLTIPRRPLRRSDNQPIKSVDGMPANSITKIAIPPSCKVAPLISLKYIGPQSSILYLTIYTKKLAAATIHKYLFLNMLSKNNSLVVSSSSLSPLVNLTSEKSFLYSSIGGRPTD
jgi:hypothetical protein